MAKKEHFNQEAEQTVLGSIFLEPKVLKKNIIEELEPSDFFSEHLKTIYISILSLDNRNIKIDYISVAENLKERKALNKAGGIDYLISLSESVPSTANIDSYVKIVKDKSNLRKLYNKFQTLMEKDNLTSDFVKESMEQTLSSIQTISNIETNSVSNYIKEYIDDLGKPQDDTEIFKTYYTGLDDVLTIKPGKFIVIGARPGIGKSALGLNIGKHFAMQNKKVLFISLEMTKKEILDRLVSNITEIPTQILERKKSITPNQWASIHRAEKEIKKYHLNIYDKGSLTIEMLSGLCNKLKQQNQLDILIIDYIGLMETKTYSNQRNQQIGHISRKLKQLSMDLEIPVIALAQLNRNVAGQDGKLRQPVLSDLRESGSIEQDANAVIFLHNKENELTRFANKDRPFSAVTLVVAKNRSGKLGTLNMKFEGQYARLRELEWVKSESTGRTSGESVPLSIEFPDEEVDISDKDLPF
jgi:replicative DNA helicase